MEPSEPTNLSGYGDPLWLTTDDAQMVEARKGLVGDYNMWVQLAGGNRETAKQLLIKDYPRGPIEEEGSDQNLRKYLASRFPWLWAYTAFQYRAGIFNTITFLIMLGGLIYIALVYVPRDKDPNRGRPPGAALEAPPVAGVTWMQPG